LLTKEFWRIGWLTPRPWLAHIPSLTRRGDRAPHDQMYLRYTFAVPVDQNPRGAIGANLDTVS